MKCYYCGCKVEVWSFLMYARDGAVIRECDDCYLSTDVKTKQDLVIPHTVLRDWERGKVPKSQAEVELDRSRPRPARRV